MDEMIPYFIKVALGHSLMLIVYQGFLRKGTHFGVNRWFLLVSLIGPCLIPWIKLHAAAGSLVGIASFRLEQILVGVDSLGETTGVRDYWMFTIAGVYLAGVCVMLMRGYRQVLLVRKIHKNSIPAQGHGAIIRVTSEKVPACSMFRNIYVSQETAGNPGLEKIVRHELGHAKHFHSADVVLAELLCVFFWFNPFVWLIRKALKEVHEYEADAHVQASDIDTTGYMLLLVNHLVGVQPTFLNQFNQSLTLKRLIMMTKDRSGKFAQMKALLGIPVLLMLAVVFSVGNQASALISITDVVSDAGMIRHEAGNHASLQQYKTATPPQYPGGNDAMMKFMQANIRYPEAARKAGIQGIVYVQFVVKASGKVTDVKVKKSVEATLDAEAIRVISMMPDWIPGQQDGKPADIEMVLPVNFKLESRRK